MTFAALILAIRRRAATMPQDVPRASAMEQAAAEVLKDRSDPAKRVLAVLVGIGEDETFDVSIFDAMTPEAIARLDLLAAEVIDFVQGNELAGPIGAALLKRAQ